MTHNPSTSVERGRTLSDLIARLEKATGPDRELDALLHEVCGLPFVMEYWTESSTEQTRNLSLVPQYTRSIDAAMTLVPGGLRTNWAGECPDGSWFFELIERDGNGMTDRVWARTPAIALCIASLKALEAQQ